jgi:hypothetical protein
VSYLESVTARIVNSGKTSGTGFFVAPGLLLSCAHVTRFGKGATVSVHYQGRKLPAEVILQAPEDVPDPDKFLTPYPDVSLVSLSERVDHDCVRLTPDLPSVGDHLRTRGFTKTLPGNFASEPATFTFDGEYIFDDGVYLKLSFGEAVPGTSGGPLLDPKRDLVCGILKTSRARGTDRGGFGIPISAVTRLRPDLLSENEAFHCARAAQDELLASYGGIEPARVAEVIVRGRRGSGYRIGQTTVLTAAHVIEGDAAPLVRFEADQSTQWCVAASSRWVDATSDLAVLTIPVPEHAPSAEAVRFGRLGDRNAVVEVRAIGFPLFKLKNYDGTEVDGLDERYRDSHQAVGSIAWLSDWTARTLELPVGPPELDSDPQISPWQGMSGAAVWVGDEIVGVIREHRRTDALGRLSAVRLDRGLDGLDSSAMAELRALVALPEHGSQLHDVIPSAEGIPTAYRDVVADIAPDQLIGREDELDDLVRFCAGDKPYAWWQAQPWAGKSALMSWLVLHPPAGVDVASFFITSRLSGESDSAAFTAALIEQLAVLADASAAGQPTAQSPHRRLRDLLKTVAARSHQARRRLLIVVDGLDEDTGAGAGQSSIASLLPMHPPPGVRVLVASRPHPLPNDVHGEHPLRELRPRQLAASPYARHLELEAKRELDDLLSGSTLQRQVLGYITASGGGLSLPDLEKLTGQAPHDLSTLTGGVFGRSLQSRGSAPSIQRTGERVYLFAHETLRVTAEEQFGGTLARYRDDIHRWADGYRELGWPPETPGYLMRGYPRMLTSTNDLGRLTTCATNTARHDRMLDYTGGDYLALTEIAAAQELNLRRDGRDDVDLEIAVRLGFERDHLSQRNANMPANMPEAWCRLGETTRAEALARAITDSSWRARERALGAVAAAVAVAGDFDRAAGLVSAITDLGKQAEALAAVADAAAEADDFDRAERLAGAIRDPRKHAQALSSVARSAAAAGNHDRVQSLLSRAEGLADAIADPANQASALTSVARSAAAAGDHDRVQSLLLRAEGLADAITNPSTHAAVLSDMMRSAAAAGDHDRVQSLLLRAEGLADATTDPDEQAPTLSIVASALAAYGDLDRAERLADAITKPFWQDSALSDLVKAASGADDYDRAERLAGMITDPRSRAEELSALARSAARTGEHERVQLLLSQAEELAHAITDPYQHAAALQAVAAAVAGTGDFDRAEGLVDAITDPREHAEALSEVAATVAGAGGEDRARSLLLHAEALARAITDPRKEADALRALAVALATARDFDRAEALVDAITDPDKHAKALKEVAVALATARDFDRAEALVDAITDPDKHAEAVKAAQAALAAGEFEGPRARELARSIDLPHEQAEASSAVAVAIAGAGDLDRAERRARVITDSDWQAVALRAVAVAAAAANDFNRAEDLARAIRVPDRLYSLPSLGPSEPREQAMALSAVAVAVAKAGKFDRAEGLARAITDPGGQAAALSAVAGAVAGAGAHDQDRAQLLFTQAEALAQDIGQAREQAAAFSAVAVAIAGTGNFDRAEGLARAIIDPGEQAKALSAVAVTAAGTSNNGNRARSLFTEAEALVRAIKDRIWQPWALENLSRAMVNAGYLDWAENVVRAIPDPQKQAAALNKLAQILLDQFNALGPVRATELLRARRYLAEALAISPWDISIGTVARLDPPAFRRAVDHPSTAKSLARVIALLG